MFVSVICMFVLCFPFKGKQQDPPKAHRVVDQTFTLSNDDRNDRKGTNRKCERPQVGKKEKKEKK